MKSASNNVHIIRVMKKKNINIPVWQIAAHLGISESAVWRLAKRYKIKMKPANLKRHAHSSQITHRRLKVISNGNRGNRIQLNKQIVASLGVQPGDYVSLEFESNKVTIKKAPITFTVNTNGRILLGEPLLRRLGLSPGAEVMVHCFNNQITVEKI